MWVVIAVIVIGGIWWWWAASQTGEPAMNSNSYGNTPATQHGLHDGCDISDGDSDQAINQDMTSVNAQMNGLSSDNASVTQSMNDQPVQQAE